MPQVAIDAPSAYAYYATCVELGLPVFIAVGIAGPRVPSGVQHVERPDQVLDDFPDLVVVMRHGAEPWTELAVKLMLKWPNLYYSTSAFAPRYYPREIIDCANTRGAEKILYGGYFPMGLSLERIFSEMPDVPFASEVWPRFIRHNAASILKLSGGSGGRGSNARSMATRVTGDEAPMGGRRVDTRRPTSAPTADRGGEQVHRPPG